MEEQERSAILKKYFQIIEIAFWIGIIGIPLLAWFLPLSSDDRQKLLILSAGTAIFTLILFRLLIPRFGDKSWLSYFSVAFAIGIIAYLSYLFIPYDIHPEILYITAIISVGVVGGRNIAYHATALSITAHIIVTLLSKELNVNTIFSLSLHILVLLLTGFVAGSLIGAIHKKAAISDRKFRYFSTLLRASMMSSQRSDLGKDLSQVAKMIAMDVPVTACRIFLLDENDQKITIVGAYPIRNVKGWNPDRGKSFPLTELPKIHHVLETDQPLILQRDAIEALQSTEYQSIVFFSGVQTVCLFPLVTHGKRLGIIIVGESRRWTREPFDMDKIELLKSLANQTAATIQNAQLFLDVQRQAERLGMLNEVARTIGSTIELENLLELIYQQVSKVVPSDTYFVSLFNKDDNTQDIRILIDEGVRFPQKTIPVAEGLSSWVIINRKPLFVKHLSKELDELPNIPITVGLDRNSESWLGIPLLAGEVTLGMVAIASYTPNAYDEADVELLSNVASQAALAIDNARHHAEVQEQARRDSLTNALNHGHFLLRLAEEVNKAKRTLEPVSLIMLDIDHFKEYNDIYGHVTGDEVLCLLVQTIQAHVKKTDIVGRWGGEEFGIILPGTSTEQTTQVAGRISQTLANVQLITRDGQNITSPTISQGISTFPQLAQSADELVDTADKALYQAKAYGRDKIIVYAPTNQRNL